MRFDEKTRKKNKTETSPVNSSMGVGDRTYVFFESRSPGAKRFEDTPGQNCGGAGGAISWGQPSADYGIAYRRLCVARRTYVYEVNMYFPCFMPCNNISCYVYAIQRKLSTSTTFIYCSIRETVYGTAFQMYQLWVVRVDGGNGEELYGKGYADIYAINRLHYKAASPIDCDHVSIYIAISISCGTIFRSI